MRRLVVPIVLLFAIAGQSSAQVFTEKDVSFKPHFIVRADGGWVHWSMADWDKFYGFYLGTKQVWIDIVGEHFKWGNDGEIELVYAFHPQLRIGISFNHAWGSGGFDYENSYQWPTEPKTIMHEHLDASITPFCITLYNNGTNYPNRPYIGIGVGYYMSSISMSSIIPPRRKCLNNP